ncbi:type VI secretion system tube protein Hcp [Roseomonas sp. AR75]|uniref:Hcp family type VI secretion system effector n=1 Tax=Roseomonas sp. AR75 TaxID=2562311 RepID=UPI0010C15254|nr:type VI secretion system tube protein Hcp [Roseomonas sp. AR75]
MAIYMKYGDIKGTVTTDGFKDWIELGSVQMGAGRGIASARGSGSNREASEPSISEITCTKQWDASSSSKLFEESVAGEMSRLVEIHFTTTGAKKQEVYLVVKLKDTGISGYSLSSGGDKPTESLSLNFAHVEVVPKVVDPKIGVKDGEKVSFDLKEMKANA